MDYITVLQLTGGVRKQWLSEAEEKTIKAMEGVRYNWTTQWYKLKKFNAEESWTDTPTVRKLEILKELVKNICPNLEILVLHVARNTLLACICFAITCSYEHFIFLKEKDPKELDLSVLVSFILSLYIDDIDFEISAIVKMLVHDELEVIVLPKIVGTEHEIWLDRIYDAVVFKKLGKGLKEYTKMLEVLL